MADKEIEELKKQIWGSPTEENQWAIEYEQDNYDKDKDFFDQDKSDSLIYIRENPPPAPMRLYDGETGDFMPGFNIWTDYTEKPFTPDPHKQPFLFRSLSKRGELVKMGKLDDESKAMLKEKYNVDVDAPVEDVDPEEDEDNG